MERNIFDSIALPKIHSAPVHFEPIGDQSTELDAAAEVAAFVGRPDRAADLDVKQDVVIPQAPLSTGLSPFAEAAGLYSSQS